MRGRWLTARMHDSERVSSTRCPPCDELSSSRLGRCSRPNVRHNASSEKRSTARIHQTDLERDGQEPCAPEESYGHPAQPPTVALPADVFQKALLVDWKVGFTVLRHWRVPSSDGGLSPPSRSWRGCRAEGLRPGLAVGGNSSSRGVAGLCLLPGFFLVGRGLEVADRAVEAPEQLR